MDTENKIDAGPVEDGWNASAAEDFGVLEFVNNVRSIGYEIQSCWRGSSGQIGNDLDGLVIGLEELADQLSCLIQDLEMGLEE